MFLESALVESSIFIPIYLIPLFFQFTKGDCALDAASRLLPFIFFLVFFSVFNGGVMGKEGHYMPCCIIVNVLISVRSAPMYTVNENTSTATSSWPQEPAVSCRPALSWLKQSFRAARCQQVSILPEQLNVPSTIVPQPL